MQQIACRQQPRLAPRHRAQPALRPQRQESERQASCCEMAANLALRSRPKGQRAQFSRDDFDWKSKGRRVSHGDAMLKRSNVCAELEVFPMRDAGNAPNTPNSCLCTAYAH